MWAVVTANPWLLLGMIGAFALLLKFLYSMARLVLSHRKPNEDCHMRLLWLFKFEIRGRSVPRNDHADDQSESSEIEMPRSLWRPWRR